MKNSLSDFFLLEKEPNQMKLEKNKMIPIIINI